MTLRVYAHALLLPTKRSPSAWVTCFVATQSDDGVLTHPG